MSRWLLSILICGGLLISGGILAGVRINSALRLPHPDQADDTQLVKWLVLRDLDEEPADVQVSLVDRLTEAAKGDWASNDPDSIKLSDAQKTRLVQNAELLKRVWFYQRVSRYGDLPSEDRFVFMTEQIETIDRWTEIVSYYADAFGIGTDSAEDLFQQIDDWVEQAPQDKRESTNKALKDGVVCWLSIRDLGLQSMATRQSLASRIAAELDRGLVIANAAGNLNDEQTSLLRKNSELLLEAWVYSQLDAYRATEPDQQQAFIDERVSKVKSWGILELLSGSGSRNSMSQLAGALRLKQLFGEWIDSASPQDREDLERLYRTVVSSLARS